MQRLRETQDRDGLIISATKRKNSPCQEVDNSQGGKRLRYLGPDLPEDIWHHIHSLLPLRNASRVACVSHTFLRSWRCYPNLTLDIHALSLKDNLPGRDFIQKVDKILKKHSGINVKILLLRLSGISDVNVSHRLLNSWLQVALTPGIEQTNLFHNHGKYNFPCSLLSDGIQNSIQHLHLCYCVFHPKVELSSFRSLVRLHLHFVRIIGDELGCLLSNSVALEKLELWYCPEIVCLKIHCMLQRLSYLTVLECSRLKVIENIAPNLSVFYFSSENQVELSFGESSTVKKMDIYGKELVCYALSKLPSSVPILESLTISSYHEVANTPMLPTKFFHLKYLNISFTDCAFSLTYNYFSLVSLLYASPALEAFTLNLSSQLGLEHLSIFEDSSHLSQTTEHHNNIKSVKVTGFSSMKSLVELTCHIVENSVSLESLMLDTTNGYGRLVGVLPKILTDVFP